MNILIVSVLEHKSQYVEAETDCAQLRVRSFLLWSFLNHISQVTK
jgi:hypothetical protein